MLYSSIVAGFLKPFTFSQPSFRGVHLTVLLLLCQAYGYLYELGSTKRRNEYYQTCRSHTAGSEAPHPHQPFSAPPG